MKLTPGETYSGTVTAEVREGAEVVVAGGGTAGVVGAIAAAPPRREECKGGAVLPLRLMLRAR